MFSLVGYNAVLITLVFHPNISMRDTEKLKYRSRKGSVVPLGKILSTAQDSLPASLLLSFMPFCAFSTFPHTVSPKSIPFVHVSD